jgi:hypothetical protein
MGEIKNLLVAATAAGEEVRPLLADPDLDPKTKLLGNFSFALLSLVSIIVENGLMPLTGQGQADGFGPKAGPPPPPPKPSPGLRELKTCLENAETESILFDVNLGTASVGNRANLCSSFSAGLRAVAIENAELKGADPAESVRAMNDALECVSEMDFIGLKSERTRQKDPVSNEQKPHFTMPIKLKFDDRNTHLHFEKTIKSVCGLRAVMSLPKNIREEQSLFAKALRDRYKDEMVTVRPDLAKLHFIAFKKGHTDKWWERCSETMPIPHGIVLPDYKVRGSIELPPVVTITDTPGMQADLEPMQEQF